LEKVIETLAGHLKSGGGPRVKQYWPTRRLTRDCYVKRNKIIATPTNSNKFTEFDIKK